MGAGWPTRTAGLGALRTRREPVAIACGAAPDTDPALGRGTASRLRNSHTAAPSRSLTKFHPLHAASPVQAATHWSGEFAGTAE